MKFTVAFKFALNGWTNFMKVLRKFGTVSTHVYMLTRVCTCICACVVACTHVYIYGSTGCGRVDQDVADKHVECVRLRSWLPIM